MPKRILTIITLVLLWAVAMKYLVDSPTWGQDKFLSIDSSRTSAIINAIERASVSVVGINVTQLKKKRTTSIWEPFFFPYARTYKVDNLGSGVLVSEDGYVITNAHVVEDAHEIVVTLMGGARFDATLVGIDNLTDISVLKIDGESLPFSALGNSDDLIVGEWAIALGNPLGLFDVSHQPTATAGIISGFDLDFGLKESGHVYQDMIQTDASINPGNSGGPLVNANGDVIGINTFILTGSEHTSGSVGIGFAIPVNRVKEVFEDLKEFGKVERNYNTGIHVQTVDRFIKRYLRLPSEEGVLIRDVEKRSSGERADLQIGDVILRVNNRKVNGANDIIRIIDEGFLKVGDSVHLSLWRDGVSLKRNMQLEEPKSKTWGF